MSSMSSKSLKEQPSSFKNIPFDAGSFSQKILRIFISIKLSIFESLVEALAEGAESSFF